MHLTHFRQKFTHNIFLLSHKQVFPFGIYEYKQLQSLTTRTTRDKTTYYHMYIIYDI